MKSHSKWLSVALMLSTAGVASSYNITFDAGYHGAFQKTTIPEDQDGNIALPADPEPISQDYDFVGWEPIPSPLESDTTVKAIYSKTISVAKESRKLLSLNLLPINSDTSFLENLITTLGSYVRDSKGNHIHFIGGTVNNAIGNFEPSEGYLVTNASQSNDVSELVSGTSSTVLQEILLPVGYSIIPFVSETEMAPEEYFHYILDSIEYVEDLAGNRYTSVSSNLEMLLPGEAYLVKLSKPRTFLPSITIAPDSTLNPAALSDGVTLLVTSPYDTDAIDGSTTWPNAAANGLTLREAVHFAGTLSGGTPETITFSPELSTLFMQDELSVTGVAFTVDGDLDNDGIEDITISRSGSGAPHRFMHATLSDLSFIGITFENFNGPASGTLFKADGDKDVTASGALLTFDNCTFSNNTGIAGTSGIIHTKEKDSFLKFTWSRFINNHTNGGAILYAQGGGPVLELDYCLLEGNTMDLDGGDKDSLIIADYSDPILKNTVMINGAGPGCYPFYINNTASFTTTNMTYIGFNATYNPASDNTNVTHTDAEILTDAEAALTPFGRMKYVVSDPISTDGAYIGYLRGINKTPVQNSAVETTLIHASVSPNASTLDITGLFTDPDGDEVTLSSQAETGANEISYANNTFTVAAGIAEGVYTYTVTGTDWAEASAEATITIEVQAPLEVTNGYSTLDALNTSSTLNDAVTNASANGLTFREAIEISNAYPGPQAIIFSDNLVISEIDAELTITDDLFILGNGVKATKLQFNGVDSSLTITNDTHEPIFFTVNNLTFSGVTANIETSDDTSATPLLAISGHKLDEDSAAFATVTLDSVECVNHTTNSQGAAIGAQFTHLIMTNSYFYNIAASNRPIFNAEYSTYTIEGMTVDNCRTTAGTWKYAVLAENRNSKASTTMSNDFRTQLNSSVTKSTFNNTTIGNGDAEDSNSSLIGQATESGSSDSLIVSHITVAASPTNKIGFRNYAEKATNSASSINSLTDVAQSTYNSVTRYDDDTVESGIFADSGANEFDDSTASVVGTVIDFDQVYGTNHTGATLKTKIGEAVDAAQPGDMLLFNSAEYDFAGEKLTIDKALTISGADAGVIDTTQYGAQNISTVFKELKGLFFTSSNIILTDIEIRAHADANSYFTHFKHPSYSSSNIDANTYDFYVNILVDNVIYRGSSNQVWAGNGAGVDFKNTSFLEFIRTGVTLDRRGRLNYAPRMTFKDCKFQPDLDSAYFDTRGIRFDAGNTEYPVLWDQNWTHVDHCLLDGAGVGMSSKCQRVKVTNSHFKGYSKYTDMIHIEEFCDNMIIENNTFEHVNPARTIYLDREAQQVSNIRITNNTFIGEYHWIIWSLSPYNFIFENNDFTGAWASDTTEDAFFFTNFHEGDYETLPYQLPAKNMSIRNNPGLDSNVHGTLTYYGLENDTSVVIEGYGGKINLEPVTEEPQAIIDVTKTYRIRNKVNGEYLAGLATETDVSLLTQEANDSTDLWTLEYNYPYTYMLKNVATNKYLEVDQGFTLGDYDKATADLPVHPVKQKYTYSENAAKPFFYFRDHSNQNGIFFEIIPGSNEWKSRVEKTDNGVELTLAKEEVLIDGKEKKVPRAAIDASLWEFIPVE